MKEKFIRFFKGETVLCAALALAVCSMFLVRPDAEYISYIDFRTLAILFCLMGTMAGLRETSLFQWVAQALLGRVRKTGQLVLILSPLSPSPSRFSAWPAGRPGSGSSFPRWYCRRSPRISEAC